MTELATVLWKPRQTIARIAEGQVRTLALVFTLLGIDFSLSLAQLPQLLAASLRAMTAHPELPHSTRWVIVAVSVAFSSFVHLALILFVALLVFFVTVVLGGTGSYRHIFEAMVICSGPLVLSRIVRILLFVFKVTPAVLPGLVPLTALVHGAPPGIARIAGLVEPADFWSLILFCYGYSCISGLRRLTSSSVVLLLWGIFEGVLIRIQMMVTP